MFQPGDWVVSKHAFLNIKHHGKVTFFQDDTRAHAWYIQEKITQECRGGTQIWYKVRDRNAGNNQFSGDELVAYEEYIKLLEVIDGTRSST